MHLLHIAVALGLVTAIGLTFGGKTTEESTQAAAGGCAIETPKRPSATNEVVSDNVQAH